MAAGHSADQPPRRELGREGPVKVAKSVILRQCGRDQRSEDGDEAEADGDSPGLAKKVECMAAVRHGEDRHDPTG